ncbi:unnamed protein product, partial [Ceratitis capitata]
MQQTTRPLSQGFTRACLFYVFPLMPFLPYFAASVEFGRPCLFPIPFVCLLPQTMLQHRQSQHLVQLQLFRFSNDATR